MKRLLWPLLALPLLLLLSAIPASAQLSNARGWCEAGAQTVTTSGLVSTTFVQASFPQCQISVSVHGGGPAIIYSTGSSTPLTNPFTSQTNGQWLFYAVTGEYDITMTGGGMPSPVTYSDVFIGSSGGGGGGNYQTIESNNTPQIGRQILNFLSATNITAGCVDDLGNNSTDCTFTPIGIPFLANDNTWTNNNRFAGPDPYADITAFGSRPIAIGSFPSTTASCNGTTTITLASAGTFQNGDGITIYGCGATNTMSTPSAPTVVPSIASGLTGSELVVSSATGATNYIYTIVARDKFGALTAASTPTTITNGLASLGLQTASVTSSARTNDTLTLTLSGASNIVAGTLIHFYGSTNAQMSGFYNVASVSGGGATVVINNTGFDTRAQGAFSGDASSSTGGTVDFFQCNHITWSEVTGAWEYYIYANRAGAGNTLIGVSKPRGVSGWRDLGYDDFGATFTANQVFPAYVPTGTPPSVATNDPLTTTIVSGAGGTTIVVANSATQTIAGQTALFDDAPGILAAANSITWNSPSFTGGYVYIPPSQLIGGARPSYVVNSYLLLPGFLFIKQAGQLVLNETVEVQRATNWFGDSETTSPGQFDIMAGAGISVQGANPGIYVSGLQDVFNYLNIIDSAPNGGTLMVVDQPFNSFDYSNFNTGGVGTDYLSTSIMFRDTSSTVSSSYFRQDSFSGEVGGTTDSTWTPLIYYAHGESSSGVNQITDYFPTFERCSFGRRGIFMSQIGGAVYFESDWSYRQGGAMPMFTFQNSSGAASGSIKIHYGFQDTETEPLIALLGPAGTITAPIDLDGADGPSAETGGIPPIITGQRGLGLNTKLTGLAYLPQNRESVTDYCSGKGQFSPYLSGSPSGGNAVQGCIRSLTMPLSMTAGSNVYWPMAVPSSVSSSASGVGTWTAGTYFIGVTGVDPSGAETFIGTPGSVTVNGSQGIQTTWTVPLGAVTVNGYWCQGTCNSNAGTWRQLWLHQAGTSITNAGVVSNGGPPNVTTAGVSYANATGHYAPLFACPETTAPAGIALFDILYCDSSAHRLSLINNNGTASSVATLVDFASPPAIGNTTPGAISVNVTGVNPQCLQVNAAGLISGTGAPCAGGGGSTAFSALTSSTNTSAAMVIGTGASLTVSGSGTNNATTLLANTWAIPGTIGSTTPSTGAFTTLAASSTVSGTGFSTYLASPPAIGGSSPAAVTSTVLSATTDLALTETTAPSGSAGKDICYGDSTAHAAECSYNNGSFFRVPQLIASGTSAMATGAIGSGACASVVTGTATGAATTDNIIADFNADPSATTGYGVSVSGILTIYKWITTNTINLKVCNSTSGTVTPGAATIQWRIVR